MIDAFTRQVNKLVLFFSRFGRFYPVSYVYYTELIYKRYSKKRKKDDSYPNIAGHSKHKS